LWAVRREMAQSVSDVLDRRTQSVFRDARAAADAAPSVAALIGPELGWSPGRGQAEAEAYAAQVRGRLVGAGLDPVSPGGERTDGTDGTPADPARAGTATGTGDPGGAAAG